MAIDHSAVLQEIDSILGEAGLRPGALTTGHHRSSLLLRSAIDRLSPPGSVYRAESAAVAKKWLPDTGASAHMALVGQLTALRADYAVGRLKGIAEIIHADLFADYMAMAEHLLGESFKVPAAVLVGSTLEAHLRKLCAKWDVAIDKDGDPRKAQMLNQELRMKGAYTLGAEKQITAWLDLRNNAAHGHYDKFVDAEVRLMIAGVRDFISRTPA